MIGDRLRRHQHIDQVVENDDRRNVVAVEPLERRNGSLARLRHADSLHGTRPIDDEGDVDGRAVGLLALAAVERNAKIVSLRFSAFHYGLGKPGLQHHRLVGAYRQSRKQEAGKTDDAGTDRTGHHGPSPWLSIRSPAMLRSRLGGSAEERCRRRASPATYWNKSCGIGIGIPRTNEDCCGFCRLCSVVCLTAIPRARVSSPASPTSPART